MTETASDALVITPSTPQAKEADALGVQVHAEKGIEMVLNEFKPLRSCPHHPPPRKSFR